jgi:hypothetical protein
MATIDGGNTFQQATLIGTATLRPGALASVEVANELAPGEAEDWFKFRVKGRASSKFASTTLGFTGGLGDTMTVFGEFRGKPKRILARLDSVNGIKQTKVLPAGKYFIKIAGNTASASTPGGTYVSNIQISIPPSNLFK